MSEVIDLSKVVTRAEPANNEESKAPEWAENLDENTRSYDPVINPDLIDKSAEEEEIKELSPAASEPGTDADKWNPSELADLIVDTIDFIQDKGGAWLHWKTALTPDQKLDLRDMIVEYGITTKTASQPRRKELSFYEKWLLQRRAEHEEYVKLQPLTEDEVTRYKNAWRRFLAGKNVEISPGWALVATSASIMLPRLLPIISNIFDNEKKEMGYAVEEPTEDDKRAKDLIKSLKIDDMTPEDAKKALTEIVKKMNDE